jgi:hypothetical protein
MLDMPRPRPPHLHRQVTRHGKPVWYVRIDKGPRLRIRALYGTPEFDIEYQGALAGMPARSTEAGPASGTLSWLIERYRETTAWAGLSQATRRQRENIFTQIISSSGNQPFIRITTAAIEAGRDRRAATPAQARHFLDAMRGLFRWAAKAKHVKVDPTANVDDRRDRQARASVRGRRKKSLPTRDVGQSERPSAYGLTCCSTPA